MFELVGNVRPAHAVKNYDTAAWFMNMRGGSTKHDLLAKPEPFTVLPHDSRSYLSLGPEAEILLMMNCGTPKFRISKSNARVLDGSFCSILFGPS